MDAARDRSGVLDRPAKLAPHLDEERLRRRGIVVDGPLRELQVRRKPDELLLHARVERTLDAPAFGVVGQHDASARRADVRDLEAQPFELRRLVVVFGIQR